MLTCSVSSQFSFTRLFASAFVVLLLAACSPSPQEVAPDVVQPVKVVTVGEGEALAKRNLPGTIRAAQRALLALQVPGKLVALPAYESQKVSKGDLLAQIDDTNYKSDLDATTARVKEAEGNFTRAEGLIEKGYVSRAEFDKIKATLDVARSDRDKAAKALQDTRLLAPFSGVVARVYVENFQEVQAKQQVLSLQNNEDLEVVLNIPESLVRKRDSKQELALSATLEGIPGESFELNIKEFSTEADPDTRTFQYVLGLKNASGHNILPGMTATVHATLLDQSGEGPLSLPLAALSENDAGQKQVWVVGENSQVNTKNVETGELIGDDSIIILSGLERGDKVVVAGISSLVPGKEVKPVSTISF